MPGKVHGRAVALRRSGSSCCMCFGMFHYLVLCLFSRIHCEFLSSSEINYVE